MRFRIYGTCQEGAEHIIMSVRFPHYKTAKIIVVFFEIKPAVGEGLPFEKRSAANDDPCRRSAGMCIYYCRHTFCVHNFIPPCINISLSWMRY